MTADLKPFMGHAGDHESPSVVNQQQIGMLHEEDYANVPRGSPLVRLNQSTGQVLQWSYLERHPSSLAEYHCVMCKMVLCDPIQLIACGHRACRRCYDACGSW